MGNNNDRNEKQENEFNTLENILSRGKNVPEPSGTSKSTPPRDRYPRATESTRRTRDSPATLLITRACEHYSALLTSKRCISVPGLMATENAASRKRTLYQRKRETRPNVRARSALQSNDKRSGPVLWMTCSPPLHEHYENASSKMQKREKVHYNLRCGNVAGVDRSRRECLLAVRVIATSCVSVGKRERLVVRRVADESASDIIAKSCRKSP